MADITIHAAYGSVVEDEGQLFIGFAEGEDEEEGYVLFRQSVGGGPVWFEVNDEGFGAEGAVEAVTSGPKGIEIALKPDMASTFGWAQTVAVRIGSDCEDAAPALEALQAMLGAVWRAGA
jgi:hypothetical protein